MTSVADLRGFAHTAVSHGSTDELVDELAPTLRDWLSRRDRVFVNLTAERADALRSALGADADGARWSDTYHWAPHPARRLRAIQDLVEGEESHGSGQLRFVGECAFPAGVPALVAEWERFDAVLNEALADAPVTMVCTYDVDALPEGVAARVPCTHPMLGVDPVVPSESYRRLHEVLDRTGALASLPASATHEKGRVAPARARSLVRGMLGGAGAEGPRRPQAVEDLAIVATELVTNAWQVGARSIEVWCWHDRGEMGVQVDDDGPGLRDPLAGYRRPASGVAGGRGLWISRQLADLLELAPNGAGTSVRARIFDGLPTSERSGAGRPTSQRRGMPVSPASPASPARTARTASPARSR